MASGKNTLGSKGLVSLMWNEYDSFVINGFSTLYQNDDLADVTLICEGRSFKAHRVILSVWSSYFREIFITNPAPHPIVILRQTSSEDFELILRFMYQGKILVPQDDADRFLKTADNFKIAGLSKMKIQNQSEIPVAQTSEFVSTTRSSLSEVIDPLTTFINMTHPNCQNIINLKSSPVATTSESFIETTEVTMANTAVTHSSPKHSITPRTSISVSTVQSSFADNLKSSVGPSPSVNVKPFPIFQRKQPKLQSAQTHQTVIGSTTIRQIENYPSDEKRCSPSLSSDDVIAFESNKMKVEAKPLVESVMVLQNFIQTNADVQTLVDPSRDEHAVSESIFNSIYNPVGGGPKQKMIQIQNQSDGSIIGYTFIPDEQSVSGMEEQNQNLLESPLSSSSHSQSENQCPEVIDLDVDDSVHSPIHILPTSSSGTTAPVTTFSVTNTNSKPAATKRRSKKRKGEHDEGSDLEEEKDLEERVACPTCAKIVKKTSLKVHMKRSHLEEGVVLLCPICGKQVSSKGVYYKHMYMHRRKSEYPSEDDRMEEFEDDM